MELKLQDYNVGDLIMISDKYLAVVTKINKWSIESISVNYPHKQNQVFITTQQFLSNIKKVTHNV